MFLLQRGKRNQMY